ncbi:J domain-containing protein [Methylopila musalis]|uniref:J domain-containing protein n=1 Tax=Methylopila musalis TaxID=1134781 RepID=A0ABW3Z6P5_9HYPH
MGGSDLAERTSAFAAAAYQDRNADATARPRRPETARVMIWLVLGAMALAGAIALGRILVKARPSEAAKALRWAAWAAWALGLVMTLTGKVTPGMLLMGLGALGMGAGAATRRAGSARFPGDGRGTASGRGPDVETDGDPRRGQGGGGRGVRGSAVMTEQEAYQILGLQPGATAEEIVRAHRALMKKVHPDQGGTAALAARVNAARDLLTRTSHR